MLLKWIRTSLRSLQFTCLCLYPIHTFPILLLFDLCAHAYSGPPSRRCLSVFYSFSRQPSYFSSSPLYSVRSLRLHSLSLPSPMSVYAFVTHPILDAAFHHWFTWLLYFPPSIWKPLSCCSVRARNTEPVGPAVLWLRICWRPHYGLKHSLRNHKRLIRNWRTRNLLVRIEK
jgi:hypothetical protein